MKKQLRVQHDPSMSQLKKHTMKSVQGPVFSPPCLFLLFSWQGSQLGGAWCESVELSSQCKSSQGSSMVRR